MWITELRTHGPRGWHTSTLSRVMFDWTPMDGTTAYHPAPAWPTIANRDNQARLCDYLRLQQSLIEQGYRFSTAGSGQGRTPSTGRALAPTQPVRQPTHHGVRGATRTTTHEPLPIRFVTVVGTIERVVGQTHPGAVRQEQILRASFMTRLPPELASTIGTFRAAVHAEMPTPSNTYQRTGTRTMRARYDLGFGHPVDPARIAGVMELKAGIASFDQQFSEGLAADFRKLLDPLLPKTAFRISWMLTQRAARSAPLDIAARAATALAPVTAQLGLDTPVASIDDQTGWLSWRWRSGQTLHLAWYQPREGEPDRFAGVWRP